MSDEDMPKIVATAMVTGPGAAMKIGLSYLRMKRGAHRSGKTLYRELVRNGMPKDRARSLRDEWEDSVSIRQLFDQVRDRSD